MASALWVLGLGASLGYMAFKREAVESRLNLAVKDWESQSAKPATDGATMSEIKGAWRYTDDTRLRDFNERLPTSERAAVLRKEDAAAQEVHQYDQSVGQGPAPRIEGVYLEMYPSI